MPEEKQVDTKKKGTVEEQKGSDPFLEDAGLLGARLSVPAWEVAGMMMAAGWAEGRQVSEAQFTKALNAFRKRPQGGGNIQI
ncbi:MAG: hypothetical protein RBR13_08040 [Tenuifilaceae bacterium]|nr:hypothetical protein [Tenuifilaceae bacterium]